MFVNFGGGFPAWHLRPNECHQKAKCHLRWRHPFVFSRFTRGADDCFVLASAVAIHESWEKLQVTCFGKLFPSKIQLPTGLWGKDLLTCSTLSQAARLMLVQQATKSQIILVTQTLAPMPSVVTSALRSKAPYSSPTTISIRVSENAAFDGNEKSAVSFPAVRVVHPELRIPSE